MGHENRTNGADPVAAVRQRLGMYFDHARGLPEHAARELVANAIDQHLAGHASLVEVQVEGDEITVRDDGAGFVFDDADDPRASTAMRHLTSPHFTATADGHAPHVHLGLHGAGLMPVVAICEDFRLMTWRGGVRWGARFRRGVLEEQTSTPDPEGVGSVITLRIDASLSTEPVTPRRHRLRADLWQAAHLFPAMVFAIGSERFHAPDGLLTDAHVALKHRAQGEREVQRTMRWRGVLPESDAEVEVVALGAHQSASLDATTRSWVNGAPSPGHGDHVAGAFDAFERLGFAPAVLCCHVLMRDVRFAGPVRDRLVCPELRAELAERLVAEFGT